MFIAFAGSVAAIVVFGIATGELVSCIMRLPAVLVVASVTVSIYGISPRAAAPAGWGVFGTLLIIEFLWEMRFIGNSIFQISPFAWVYPGVEVSVVSIVIMLSISVALTGIGLLRFTRRDIVAE